MPFVINNTNRYPIVIPDATQNEPGVIKLSDIPSSGYPDPTTTPDSVSAGAITIDGSIKNTLHLITLSASAVLSVTTPVTGERYRFRIANAGAFGITWPGTFNWPGGAEPTLTANGIDLVQADYNGTDYDCSFALDSR